MSKLTIVATVKSLPGAEKKVQRELVGLVDATRAEEGCLEYRLHTSIDDSAPS
ncbi:putative quinol monooxygenase [Anaeroselena agilis]|uniref:Antibiotic biosynthesis monooxygenase n=1 Tax=Anaeroselena agilis TaxID=3063788 RepID=A0ABU3NUE0_9FIRM|nr:antibiotic biosynthesis monooxygenase [Selenomonadales bacterium 4137-cl]